MEPAVAESNVLNQAHIHTPSKVLSDDNDTVAIKSGSDKVSLLVKVEQIFNLTDTVKKSYQHDKQYSKILDNLKSYTSFRCKDGLVFMKNLLRWDVICIPCEAFQKER